MPDRHMPPALRFMLAARRMELSSLEGLALTCELVTRICQLVHALQRERGYSNLYLGKPDHVHLNQLHRLSEDAQLIEQAVCARFEAMGLDTTGAVDCARLFNRIAFVLQSLQALPPLRRRIRERRLEPHQAVVGLTQMIDSLLAVVREAANSASDPAITRQLVALFTFMQGKELAGQERATGVAGFIAGWFDAALHARMDELGHAQARCFDTFVRFASERALALWEAQAVSENTEQFEALRIVALQSTEQAQVDVGFSELWFDLCTQRLDALHGIEQALTQALAHLCQRSIAAARSDLENHRLLLGRLALLDADPPQPPGALASEPGVLVDALTSGGSVLDLLRAQAQRLAKVTEELEKARSPLTSHP